ncbi:TraX family protein [Defluviitalea raffinosedens]|nr:hypothetical protein [Defluviitalea raffinosedens]
MNTETVELNVNAKNNIWNRDVIKYIAMFTMLLNHISHVFMERGSFLSEFFLDIGYFTAITMCYFLVEGYQYTRSKKKYACRLAVFAMISEIPFCLAFTKDGIIGFYGMNMMFTLLLCFLILLSIERIDNKFLRRLAITGLILLSCISDWGLLAPFFTLMFARAKDSKRRVKRTYVISCILFALYYFSEGIVKFPLGKSIIYALGAMAGMALSGIVIIYLYNGKRMEKGKTFSKWFFYVFYPLHLLILGLLRLVYLM